MNAAELPAPQIGRILVAAGLLTEEQLAQALEEQEQTGKRLGEIVVRRGFMSGPALANALAEQHGGVLKTEYGFASGLGGVAARRAASESGAPISPLRPPDSQPLPQLRTADPPAPAPEPEPEAQIREEQDGPVEPTAPIEAIQAFLRPADPPAAVVDPEPEPEPKLAPEPEPEEPVTTRDAPVEPVAPPTLIEPLRPPTPDPVQPLLRPVEPPPPVPEPAPELERASEPQPEETAATGTPVEPVAPLTPPEPLEAPQPFLRPVEPPPLVPELEPEPVPVPEQPVADSPTEVAWVESEPERDVEPEPFSIEPLAMTGVPEPFDEAFAPETHPTPYAEPEPQHETQPEPELPPVAAVPDDRDALIESLRDRVDAQEQEIAVLRGQLEQERERKDVQVHVWPEEQPSPEPPAPSQPESYLLCVPTSAGYVLLDREGTLPKVGEPVAVPEQNGNFTVTKLVRLPRNGRPCAYLQRA